ncbi:hypothetical protein [Micromonospora sp. DT31]|uniref:hypothetical protein n=1 Tax=Micromonospora sp. DT31 TaxID=3393434 RepID=UPI003CF2DFA5
MAFRTWGRLLLTALGVSVLAGAGQLGIAYGFGVLRLDGAFVDEAVNRWPAQLTWVGWVAAVTTVAAAALTGRFARSDDRPPGSTEVLSIAGVSALGALAIAPLAMQPARAAELAGSADPVSAVGICAVLGAVVGAGVAIAVLLRPPLGWGVAITTGTVWLLALVSAVPTVLSTRPLSPVRLGILDPSWLSTSSAQSLAMFLPPVLALLAGGAVGALARRAGCPPLVGGATGAAGPALVAFAYLTAGTGTATDRYQLAPYYGALFAVLTGALGSTVTTLLPRPATPAGESDAVEPTDVLAPLPPSRAATTRVVPADLPATVTGAGSAPAHWSWPEVGGSNTPRPDDTSPITPVPATPTLASVGSATPSPATAAPVSTAPVTASLNTPSGVTASPVAAGRSAADVTAVPAPAADRTGPASPTLDRGEPEPRTPERPEPNPATPDRPEPTTPDRPEPTTPDRPEPTTPGRLSPATPGRPEPSPGATGRPDASPPAAGRQAGHDLPGVLPAGRRTSAIDVLAATATEAAVPHPRSDGDTAAETTSVGRAPAARGADTARTGTGAGRGEPDAPSTGDARSGRTDRSSLPDAPETVSPRPRSPMPEDVTAPPRPVPAAAPGSPRTSTGPDEPDTGRIDGPADRPTAGPDVPSTRGRHAGPEEAATPGGKPKARRGLFRRGRVKDDPTPVLGTPEPAATGDDEYVDWVTGLASDKGDGPRSLRTGRHHRD